MALTALVGKGIMVLATCIRAPLPVAAVLGLLTINPVAAQTPGSEDPIAAHVDQSGLKGRLPAPVFEELRRQGEFLFTRRFTASDGAGRPLATQAAIPTKRPRDKARRHDRLTGPDATACSACHSMPAIGGAGDFAANSFVSEPAGINERGTTHMFGAGLIELLAREMTAGLHALREEAIRKASETERPVTARLVVKGVDFGAIVARPSGTVDLSEIDGIDTDLVVRPFGQKGVFASLREFTVHTLNHHHGMQAEERFGFAQTGELDFDGDGVNEEITAGDVSALVAWQAGLRPPMIMDLQDDLWRRATERGRAVFVSLGCDACHKPSLPLEGLDFADPGPVDAPGTLSARLLDELALYDLGLTEWAASLPRDDGGRILVPLFGDLKRHRIVDDSASSLGSDAAPQRGVPAEVFMTAELWGLASTAPYGHRNDHLTIDEIIRAHGGSADSARAAYVGADEADRDALIAFLRTLVITP